jgi:hypothetical protein
MGSEATVTATGADNHSYSSIFANGLKQSECRDINRLFANGAGSAIGPESDDWLIGSGGDIAENQHEKAETWENNA